MFDGRRFGAVCANATAAWPMQLYLHDHHIHQQQSRSHLIFMLANHLNTTVAMIMRFHSNILCQHLRHTRSSDTISCPHKLHSSSARHQPMSACRSSWWQSCYFN